MDVRLKVALGALAALALVGLPAPDASAAPSCEHREAGHVDKHGGKLEDDRFHLSRGERVTCDGDSDHSNDKREEPREAAVVPGHRDHEGFHCYHLHCG
jgi:hypothetical protein